MQRQDFININKSIDTGYLTTVEKKSFWLYGELAFTILVFCNIAFAFCLLILEELKISNIPDRIFTILLVVLLALTLYGIYRIIVEHKLSFFTHNLTKTNIKRIIFNHLTDLDKASVIETDDLVIAKKIKSYYYVEYVFLIKKDKVYFNITNHFPKLNPPIFFSHLYLKRDLQKLVDLAVPIYNANP